MDWATILPGLAALLAKLTGLQRFEQDSPTTVTDPTIKAKLDYRVISVVPVGEDEWRWQYDDEADPNEAITLLVAGTRRFTLSVRCTSYDHGFTKSAEYYLERIYTRLGFPSSGVALRALNCAWVDSGPFVNLSAARPPEDRHWSIGQKDFMFCFAQAVLANADPEAPDAIYDGPMGTIDSVELESVYLYDPGGAPLEKQIGPVIVP